MAILVFFLISELGAADPAFLNKKVQKEVSKIFDSKMQYSQILLGTEELKQATLARDADQLYIFQGPDDILGYVFSTSARGRYDYFDYSVIFSEDYTVLGVLVTTYRSSHGAAICSKGWLKQFRGYHGEKIRLGKEVDSISGATISATSIVADINRCYLLMEELGNSGVFN